MGERSEIRRPEAQHEGSEGRGAVPARGRPQGAGGSGGGAAKAEKKPEAKPEKKAAKKAEAPAEGIASFDDFLKIKLVAAKVVACERVANSEKLLKETLDIGGGQTRTVCSGIAKHYKPEDLVGKTVVLVANFAPRKMAGQVSEGMLLCAEDPDGSSAS